MVRTFRAVTFAIFDFRICKQFIFIPIDSKRGTALACTGLRNKQILRGFVPHQKYFVDIFGIRKNIPGLTLKLGSTALVFNRSNPIELSDDQIEHGRLAEFDKRSSFIFKVKPDLRLRNAQYVKECILVNTGSA